MVVSVARIWGGGLVRDLVLRKIELVRVSE